MHSDGFFFYEFRTALAICGHVSFLASRRRTTFRCMEKLSPLGCTTSETTGILGAEPRVRALEPLWLRLRLSPVLRGGRRWAAPLRKRNGPQRVGLNLWGTRVRAAATGWDACLVLTRRPPLRTRQGPCPDLRRTVRRSRRRRRSSRATAAERRCAPCGARAISGSEHEGGVAAWRKKTNYRSSVQEHPLVCSLWRFFLFVGFS